MGDSRSESAQITLSAAGLNLDDLCAFIEVARSGSFRVAAANLYTSQPSVSRAVARLEAGLGVQLLDRGPRGTRVTQRGAILLDGARQLLASANSLRCEVIDLGQSTLQLGATATSARTILAPFLAHWISAHPEITVNAIESDEAQLLALLRTGGCDAAIVSGSVDHSILESLKILRAKVIALFPPDHHLATTSDPVDIGELATEPLLINGRGFPAHAILMKEFARLDVTPRVVYQSSVGQTLAAMSSAGMGVALFGDAVDLRAFDLVQRPVVGVSGEQLAYDLVIAWHRAAPEWIREFAIDLATAFRRA